MRCLMILWIATLGLSVAAQGMRGGASLSTDAASSKTAEVQIMGTNHVYRSLKYPGLTYSGAAVQAAHSRHPWQLLNPFAPASYGSGVVNTDYEPGTARATGVRLFTLSF